MHVSIPSGMQRLLGQQKFQGNVKEGGGGSDLNDQFTLIKEKVNMSTAPKESKDDLTSKH